MESVTKQRRASFLSSYLNLLRKDVYKAYQANEGEISASWGVETLSFGRTASCTVKRTVALRSKVLVFCVKALVVLYVGFVISSTWLLVGRLVLAESS
jgi:hypothetical protein